MIRILKNKKFQDGQTLIETLVACFILVMGISSALALASYSLGATGNIKQQIIGMGLAREGIEVVKNMRDTNWLRGNLSTECYNFSDRENTALCYQDWLNAERGYNLSGDSGINTYFLSFDRRSSLPWKLTPTKKEFGLKVVTDNIKSTLVYYNAGDNNGFKGADSGFARKITITRETQEPFDQKSLGPRLKITSQVWWSGKNCEFYVYQVNLDKSCSVTLETYLTNWRVF